MDVDDLDPDIFCLRHGKRLLDGDYGFKASNCEDCEPPEPAGECFRGREAAAFEAEQTHRDMHGIAIRSEEVMNEMAHGKGKGKGKGKGGMKGGGY